jgi:hypothetical protein
MRRRPRLRPERARFAAVAAVDDDARAAFLWGGAAKLLQRSGGTDVAAVASMVDRTFIERAERRPWPRSRQRSSVADGAPSTRWFGARSHSSGSAA